ncbi:MAG TPA: hypothetical protein VFW11_20165 [Cyclobacteriaceae bacterium]|nr:hypothetical protein [Cyclobacteriaceae bacterium]
MFERNVILIITTGVVGALTYFVKDANDSKIPNRFPRVFKLAKKLLIPLYVLAFLITVVLTGLDNVEENRQNEKQGQEVTSQGKKIDSLSMLLERAEENVDSIKNDLFIVRGYAKRTDSTLNSFTVIALKKFPKSDSTDALRRLYNSINVNVRNQNLYAPNAQIATIGQVGSNYIHNSIPNVKINSGWIYVNKKVDSIKSHSIKRKQRLPTKGFPYDTLYEHQFEVTYSSPVMRNRVVFVLHSMDIVGAVILHNGQTKAGSGKIKDYNWRYGYYYVALSQPEDGKYSITFYSTNTINDNPIVEAIP